MVSQKITRKDLIKKYLEFFESKKHKVIPSASLVPANDPTVLFTTAGMHPLVPYLLGQKHPLGRRLVNVQRCLRTVDIDNIGDTYHHTLFEMMGNWSLGDYWKEDAIKMTFEFFTKVLKMSPNRLAATCFAGNSDVPKDKESYEIYLELGFPKERIAFLPKESNFWGPAGQTGPCGPNTEMFYWKSNEVPAPKKFNPEDERWVEVGNNVLMEYQKTKEGKFLQLEQKNIDFGGGMERTLAVINGLEDNYLTDIWKPIIESIEKISEKSYENLSYQSKMRIVADHIRSSVFISSDGVTPSNVGRGYILRRFVRRAVRYGKELGMKDFTAKIAESIFKVYKDNKELVANKKMILVQLDAEEKKFQNTLDKGLYIFSKISPEDKKTISGEDAFLLYQSYGFPIEMTVELAKEKGFSVNVKEFEKELKNHQELSRTTSSGSFKSGLADSSEKTTRLHTATHLLNEALRKVLGTEVKQRGSNITPERLRFDFSFDRKLTEDEIKSVEKLVNDKIKKGLEVKRSETDLKDAMKSALKVNLGKIPPIVSVYSIGDFSKEICTTTCKKHKRNWKIQNYQRRINGFWY